MATNAPTRYNNISYKPLNHSGSPTIYQLIPKTGNIGNIKKMTLGEKDPTKVHKTILLVGETGTGKSTLINAMVNYAMGVTWEDNVWFEIVEKEERNQSQSQTSDVVVYEIFGFEDKPLPYSLTIIDTPGYGDTRGPEQDDAITTRLFDLFQSEGGVYEINVVGLVMKATENRLTDRLIYIFDSVVSLFGKDMEKNIVPLFTHSNGRKPKNVLTALQDANIKCAKDEANQPVYFLFDNSQNEDRTEEEEPLQIAYELTMKGMSKFGEFLRNTNPLSLRETVDVLNKRIRLRACIQNLKERIQLIESQQKEIQQTREELKKHEEEMNKNKNFTIEVDETYKDKENIKGGMWGLWFYEGATCCTVCEENCHYPECTMAWYPKDCQVMSKGRCTVCTGKCPVSDHVKEEWRYVQKTRKVQKTLEEVKEKYNQSSAACEEKSSLLETLQKKMDDKEKDKDRWLEQSYNQVLKLEQIALNADSLSTLVHLDFLIEKMTKKGDTQKVQKLKEMKSRANEGTRAGMGYMMGRLNFLKNF